MEQFIVATTFAVQLCQILNHFVTKGAKYNIPKWEVTEKLENEITEIWSSNIFLTPLSFCVSPLILKSWLQQLVNVFAPILKENDYLFTEKYQTLKPIIGNPKIFDCILKFILFS